MIKVILRVQIKKNPSQNVKCIKNVSSDEDDTPLMKFAKRMQEKEGPDKLGNDDTSAEDQKSVYEVINKRVTG